MSQSLNLIHQCNYGIEYLPENTTQNNAGGLNFWRPFGSSGGYKNFVMHIADNGNVGIGTGRPHAALHINHTGGSWSYGVILDVNDTDQNNPSKAFTLRNSENDAELFMIWGNGVVNAQTIWAEAVRVRTSPVVGNYHWADFVFDPNYELISIEMLEEYILENKKLPGIPSEAEVIEQGIDVFEMNVLLLQKIEELTLYIISLENRIQYL